MKSFVNCFYAVKVQFFTELYLLCEKNGCDYAIFLIAIKAANYDCDLPNSSNCMKFTKIVVLVKARLGSTRLTSKVSKKKY